MKIIELNHVALYVRDVTKSIEFYKDIIGLKQIGRPAFSFGGAWFEISKGQQLHLIELSKEDSDNENLFLSKPKGNHFALRVTSYKEAEELLRSRNAEYLAPRQRPDGAMQIFIKDPDGYYIELVEIAD